VKTASCPAETVRVLDGYFGLLYGPLEDVALREAARREWTAVLGQARCVDPVALEMLLCECEEGPLPEHRARVIEIALGALDSVEVLVSALWAEALASNGHDLSEYRVLSNDIDLLKSRYLDVFELAFHSLVFMARVANIARRGDSRAHTDGYSASLTQALDHSKTRDRERWLIDFPGAARLYRRLKRATRNDISHGRLRYDYRHGQLIYSDARRDSYLGFLIDYLHAVRLTHHMIDVIIGLGLAYSEVAGRTCANGALAGGALSAGAVQCGHTFESGVGVSSYLEQSLGLRGQPEVLILVEDCRCLQRPGPAAVVGHQLDWDPSLRV
jgi:hypothetical protein